MPFHKKKYAECKEDEISRTLTFFFRILGSSNNRYLRQRGFNVNMVWNYINEVSYHALRYNSKWLSKTDLQDLTAGTSTVDKESLILCSKTVQAVCHKHHDSRKGNSTRGPKALLRYRSRFDPGWVPFRPREEDIKMPAGDSGKGLVRYAGRWISFKAHRPFPKDYKLNQAEFVQNSKGDWFVAFSLDFVSKKKDPITKEIGIDLNFSEGKQVALSDGQVFGRKNFSKEKIRKANKIHRKIYRLKFAESERELLAKKKDLTERIYSESSQETDDSKSALSKELGLLRSELSRIWKARLRLMPAREKGQIKKKLKRLYRSLSRIEYRYAEKRRDFQHKTSRKIADNYSQIFVGKALDKRFAQSRMAKSFLDLAPSEFRAFVKYKAEGNGYFADCEVLEHGSSFSCGSCLSDSGPKGLEGLKIRLWTCEQCKTVHDRDQNSADIIKRLGRAELVYCRDEKRIKISVGLDAMGKP